MWSTVRKFFEENLNTTPEADRAHHHEQTLHLATAALLLEISLADNVIEEAELNTVTAALNQLFDIPQDEIDTLVELATEEARDATDMFQFTRLVDQGFDAEEKKQIVGMLWQVAYADDNRDHHEEHAIRRIADLLHVPHRDFIAAKLAAESAGTSDSQRV